MACITKARIPAYYAGYAQAKRRKARVTGMERGERCTDTPELRNFLTDKYRLDGESAFSDLGGSNNLNLLVSQEGKLRVARVYRPWVTPSRMLDTNRALTVLAEELPVPVKRPTREGDMFCQWDGALWSWRILSRLTAA